jgi:hypothetical protein
VEVYGGCSVLRVFFSFKLCRQGGLNMTGFWRVYENLRVGCFVTN